jgi:glycosyltransferase involved in cell wall biosynthesis
MFAIHVCGWAFLGMANAMNRVCHIVQSYYPRDPRIRRQAEALVEAGFEVDVICLRGPGQEPNECVNGVGVTRLPLGRRRGGAVRYVYEYAAFFLMAAGLATLRARRYNVVHVSNMPDSLIFTALFPKLFGAVALLDEHDPFPELLMSRYGLDERHGAVKMVRWIERISLRFADHIMTTTHALKEHYEAIVGNKPVSVVMNLPDDRMFRPQENLEQTLADSSNGFVLLYAGTVSGIYNLDMAVRAVGSLKSAIPSIRLWVLGDGDDLPRLRMISEELGVTDRVDFVGDVPFNRVPEYIARSSVGLSLLKLDPLTDMCFNNKAGEYVAMGLPCISTRTTTAAGHFPEDVVRFVEPGSQESLETAIVELYNHPEARLEMSRRGLAFTRTANWSTEKRKYVELIGDLCARR